MKSDILFVCLEDAGVFIKEFSKRCFSLPRSRKIEAPMRLWQRWQTTRKANPEGPQRRRCDLCSFTVELHFWGSQFAFAIHWCSTSFTVPFFLRWVLFVTHQQMLPKLVGASVLGCFMFCFILRSSKLRFFCQSEICAPQRKHEVSWNFLGVPVLMDLPTTPPSPAHITRYMFYVSSRSLHECSFRFQETFCITWGEQKTSSFLELFLGENLDLVPRQ